MFKIEKKFVKGGVFGTWKQPTGKEYVVVLPSSPNNTIGEPKDRYKYISESYGHRMFDLSRAKLFATEDVAKVNIAKNQALQTTPHKIIQISELIKEVFRCGDGGTMEKSWAPLSHSGGDWKTTEPLATKAAVKRLKKKIEAWKNKFEDQLRHFNSQLSRLEPNSLIFIRDLCAEIMKPTSEGQPNEIK